MVTIQARVMPASLRRITDGMRARPARIASALEKEFGEWGASWQRGVQERFGSDATLRKRSGMLSQSIGYTVTAGTLGGLRLRNTSTGVNYARQREHGGVIKAKAGGFLAIPTLANKTEAGVARFPSPRDLINAHPLGKETFFFRAGDGGKPLLLLMLKTPSQAVAKSARKFKLGGSRGQAVAMFTLVKEVDQPGPKSVKHPGPSRLGFFDEWNARRDERARGLQRIARRIAKAGSGA